MYPKPGEHGGGSKGDYSPGSAWHRLRSEDRERTRAYARPVLRAGGSRARGGCSAPRHGGIDENDAIRGATLCPPGR